MASRPPVCLLTLCGHISWNTLKVITRLISASFLLSADHNMDLRQWEHQNRSVAWKKSISAYRKRIRIRITSTRSTNVSEMREMRQDKTKVTIEDQ